MNSQRPPRTRQTVATDISSQSAFKTTMGTSASTEVRRGDWPALAICASRSSVTTKPTSSSNDIIVWGRKLSSQLPMSEYPW